MKTINVVAAIIIKGERIFATQRGYGEFKDGWEFPGGKIEVDEEPAEALKREIWEEVDTDIQVNNLSLTSISAIGNSSVSFRTLTSLSLNSSCVIFVSFIKVD